MATRDMDGNIQGGPALKQESIGQIIGSDNQTGFVFRNGIGQAQAVSRHTKGFTGQGDELVKGIQGGSRFGSSSIRRRGGVLAQAIDPNPTTLRLVYRVSRPSNQ